MQRCHRARHRAHTLYGLLRGLLLTLDSVRVVLPSRNGVPQTTVYSGDTLLVIAHVTNRGTVVPDSSTRLSAYSFDGAYGAGGVGPIPPGSSKRLEIRVDVRRISDPQTRDSLMVELAREGAGVPHGYEFIAEKQTPSYAFAPTTMELRSVPAVIRYPSTTNAELVITNPSPYPRPAAPAQRPGGRHSHRYVDHEGSTRA